MAAHGDYEKAGQMFVAHQPVRCLTLVGTQGE
jgi:hypothetical protein